MTHAISHIHTKQADNSGNEISTSSPWQQHSFELSDDALAVFLERLSRAVFLDSGQGSPSARYHIISGEPIRTLSHCAATQALEHLESAASEIPELPKSMVKLPFSAGLLGFVSYDYGEQNLLSTHSKLDKTRSLKGKEFIPTIYIGLFTWSLVKDLKEGISYLSFSPLCTQAQRERIRQSIETAQASAITPAKHDALSISWRKTSSEAHYLKNLEKIQSYIAQGDCYQVNFTQHFAAQSEINALDYYLYLRKRTQTPYSCYMQFSPNCALLSFSPEQFLGIAQRRIETKPIKGTIENIPNSNNAERLASSAKNQAENLMIVDLLRNDLSKVCQLHSVRVDELFALETFNNVHHLVSHISGELNDEVTELQAFFSCFPGGSITGAPKKRAMEIINELEDSTRSAYCGSVFYLNHDGNFDSSILIRTIVKAGKHLHCWGGGGIVSDSDINEEYQESLIKVANLTGIRD